MHSTLVILFSIVEALYLVAVGVTLWFYTRPVNLVQRPRDGYAPPTSLPKIVLFYPVLRELESTMRTTFTGMAKADYPAELLRVIAIPNDNDEKTVASLRGMQAEFPFLEVMPVPPTTDPSWQKVWSSWDAASGAYWWHTGKRAGDSNLPPKKTRQLVWAMYQVAPGNEDSLLSYIDADSVIPTDYWQTAAVGIQDYDVLQNTNITGNLLSSWPASFYAMDHISWDSSMYKHMSADGKHPFWVLGKGLFFRFRDLLEAGGFHPWLTIEDPEIGMRLWTRGAKLGVIESPLVEEVPATWSEGVTQRKRWVAGFFQSLGSPLVHMGMSPMKRFRARLNFVPCLSLILNPLGFAVGIWAIVASATSSGRAIPVADEVLAIVTMVLAVVVMGYGWLQAWRMTRPVLATRRERVTFVLRVNPIFQLVYWLWWSIPLAKGFVMFVRDHGLVWERTEKLDANHDLVRLQAGSPVPDATPEEQYVDSTRR
jgi:cellulose synthase/poly-beta-1,6-N-acetylglucosamine synthase-like glycosyltransferase